MCCVALCCTGDAGAIGRVVCTPAAAGTAEAHSHAVARIASRVQDKKGKGTKAAAGDSGCDDACSSGSLDVQGDMAVDSQSDSEGNDGCVTQGAGVPALDMKGAQHTYSRMSGYTAPQHLSSL